MMKLEFRAFQKAWYDEYAAWFVDAELNRRLGPMDLDWLEAVLAMLPAEGEVWAVFREEELVAVVEAAFHPEDPQCATITALATKPTLRRQGIGLAVLQQLIDVHYNKGIREHRAHLGASNHAVRALVEKLGFEATTEMPDAHGYIGFRRQA